MGDVVEVQHGGWAEDVHFRFLRFLPARLASAFSSFPFTWHGNSSVEQVSVAWVPNPVARTPGPGAQRLGPAGQSVPSPLPASPH